jgi:MFS transporter, NNP family, nitrate/nitrite transporter
MKLGPILIFWGLWFVNFSTRTVFAPLLPLIEDRLSLSHGQAGGLYTSLGFGYGISLFFAGRFASVWGHKKTVVSGFVGIAAAVLLFQWAETYIALHGLCFLTGIALGTYIPSILPIITETYDRKHWGKAIGVHDSAASFSLFTTPVLVAFGLSFFSWKSLLLFLGAAALLLPFLFWKIAGEPTPLPSQKRGNYADLFRTRTVWILGFLWIVSSAACAGIFNILPLYLVKERGMDFEYANTLLGISRCGGILATILFGVLCDRYGYRKILVISILATGLGTLPIPFVRPVPWLIILLTFQAMISLGFFPLAFAALSNLTSPSERSMMVGIILALSVFFGNGVTPFLLGTIADHYDFRTGILGVGIVTTFSCLLVGLLKDTRGTQT